MGEWRSRERKECRGRREKKKEERSCWSNREGRGRATCPRELSHRDAGEGCCSILPFPLIVTNNLVCSAKTLEWHHTPSPRSPPPPHLSPLPTCLLSLGQSTFDQAQCRQAPLEACSQPWWLWDTLLP